MTQGKSTNVNRIVLSGDLDESIDDCLSKMIQKELSGALKNCADAHPELKDLHYSVVKRLTGAMRSPVFLRRVLGVFVIKYSRKKISSKGGKRET